MKPLKLILSAFGNYAKEQEIDFTVLNGRNIFLITGNTGAGKTTIFDAISYALYGSPSGDFRDTASLRSHYVDGSVETFVELEFELRGKLYRIRRSPEQSLNKKRGEGQKKESAKVELTFLDSDEKPLTKVKDVEDRIIELLGVDKDQFRQIVMLPQGEFLKLLKANSKDREEIFRKIFGTEGFKRTQDRLRDKVKELWIDIKDSKSERDIYLKQIKAERESLLESLINSEDINWEKAVDLTLELIKEDEEKVKSIIEECNQIRNQSKELTSKLSLIDGEKKVINEYFAIEEDLAKHKENQDVVKSYEQKLLKGRKAEKINNIENSYLEELKRKNNKEKELENSLKYKEEIKELLLKKESELKLAKDKTKEKENLIITIKELEKKQSLVANYLDKKGLVERLSKELLNNEKNLQVLKGKQEKDEQLIGTIIEEINKDIKARAEADRVKVSGTKHSEDIKKLNELKNSYKYIEEKNISYNKEKESFEKLDLNYKKIKTDYEYKEEIFKKGQAGLLAENLIEGMECPVCGSTEHPKKAIKIKELLSEEELKALKNSYEKKRQEREESLRKLTALKNEIENYHKDVIKKAISDLNELLEADFLENYNEIEQKTIIDNQLALIDEIRRKERAEYAKWNRLFVNKDEKEKEKLELENKVKNIKLEIENLINNINSNSSNLAVEKESLKSIEKEVPENLRTSFAIKKEIESLSNRVNIIDKDIEEKDREFKEVNNKAIKIDKEIELYKNDILILTKEVEEKLKSFKGAIISEGFESEEAYKESKAIENLDLIEKRINDYNEKLRELEVLFKGKKKDLDELKEKDIEQLKNKEESLREKLRELESLEKSKLEICNQLGNRSENNKMMIKKVKAVGSKVSEKEDIYGKLSHLSNVANGDKGNNKKVTFESYVLTSYFDEIIIRANYRLDKMTNGRFLLKRKEDLAKGNKKQGLDLEVYDNNTGRERGVNSLSGGESFKTALCLALGLADVIQSYAGGISIDTMFVDEGFGTLDPQSLDSAIECLVNIQQGGRLVGIISHVDELKERIDAKLEVKVKDGEGSKAQFLIK